MERLYSALDNYASNFGACASSGYPTIRERQTMLAQGAQSALDTCALQNLPCDEEKQRHQE